MVNYQNGKIYKLVGNGLTYYGSTCDELYKRLYNHKNNYNKCKSKLLFDSGDKVEIILVEKFPCNDKIELYQRERYYIENFECVNRQIPNRTLKEYRDNNKEKMKDWIENNKEKILEYRIQYNNNNKDKRNKQKKEWVENNKNRINEYNKEYREKNNEKLKQYKREWREKNRDKINEKKREWYKKQLQ